MSNRTHMKALKAHSQGLLGSEEDSDYMPYRGGDWNDEELVSATVAKTSVPNHDSVGSRPQESPRTLPQASRATSKRTRLNVSNESRDRLRDIVQRMRNYGIEKDLRASEVLEGLILALDDAKQYIEMSNVGRRGRFGSASHKNFPVALAVSIGRAIAANEREKAG